MLRGNLIRKYSKTIDIAAVTAAAAAYYYNNCCAVFKR